MFRPQVGGREQGLAAGAGGSRSRGGAAVDEWPGSTGRHRARRRPAGGRACEASGGDGSLGRQPVCRGLHHAVGPAAELLPHAGEGSAGLSWSKSSYSSGAGGEGVEAAARTGTVHVRGSEDTARRGRAGRLGVLPRPGVPLVRPTLASRPRPRPAGPPPGAWPPSPLSG
ncbi:DUF397 domain-containing protein [Streptomyces sp. DH37]|uniref:DUF397 domain-containing protein n=1 Tax=Streptomyces sp. DH37 TaxID=3040122 RepID=UPI003014EA88